jgi:Ca2+-binding RTX toxin-like protein
VSVVEAADGGTDRMIFTVSGTMGANVEVGVAGGTAAVAITGNGGDEILGGNAAANVIDGGGGVDVIVGQAGADTLRGGEGDDILEGSGDADTLTGGAGADEFVIGAYAELGVDKITDFTTGSDFLLVINPYASGDLLADALVQGTQAKDNNDFFIYDQSSGNLWIDYDADGPEAKILLATFTAGTAIAGTDISLITEADFAALIKDVDAVLVI